MAVIVNVRHFFFFSEPTALKSLTILCYTLYTFSLENYVPVQLHPSPVNPGLQEQLNDPSVLLHKPPSLLQLWVSWAHSLISKGKF